MSVRRSDSLPHPRATALFAQTVYRELRRAGYERADLVRFLSDMMSLIGDDAKSDGAREDWERLTVVDPETGLPNMRAAEEILDFEIEGVRSAKTPSLLVVLVEVRIAEWCPDDLAARTQMRTATGLRRVLRTTDTIVRSGPNQYVAALPNGTMALVPGILERLATSLPGVDYSVRATTWHPSLANARALIDACLAEAPTTNDPPPPSTELVAAVPRTAPKAESTPNRPRAVVLALGGGAGRSAAHVGVIRALEASGIAIEGIAGTSAGALVGAMHLRGLSPDAMLERFEGFVHSACYKQMRRFYAGYLRRAKRTRSSHRFFLQSGWAFLSDVDIAAIPDDLLVEFVEYFVGSDVDIGSLPKPFATTATDIVQGRPSLYSRGPLHAALRATCAVPGLFAPQKDGTRLVVDGAVIADVPVGAALALGVSAPVVAVYLERAERQIGAFATSSEVLTRASTLVHSGLVREQLRHAPVLVTVPVGSVSWLDFRNARRTADIGERAARESFEDVIREIELGPISEPAPLSRRER